MFLIILTAFNTFLLNNYYLNQTKKVYFSLKIAKNCHSLPFQAYIANYKSIECFICLIMVKKYVLDKYITPRLQNFLLKLAKKKFDHLDAYI